jgi:hypothetical protein
LAAADIEAVPTNSTSTGTSIGTSTGATAGTGDTAIASGSRVAIKSTALDPGTFFTGDTGTLTVRVANRGTDPVRIRRASRLVERVRRPECGHVRVSGNA